MLEALILALGVLLGTAVAFVALWIARRRQRVATAAWGAERALLRRWVEEAQKWREILESQVASLTDEVCVLEQTRPVVAPLGPVESVTGGPRYYGVTVHLVDGVRATLRLTPSELRRALDEGRARNLEASVVGEDEQGPAVEPIPTLTSPQDARDRAAEMLWRTGQ